MGKCKAIDFDVPKVSPNSVLVVGFDLSLNHGAAVQLLDGELLRVSYATDLVGSVKRGGYQATRMNLPKTDDFHQKQIWRLQWWRLWLQDTFRGIKLYSGPTGTPEIYIGIEDYALGGVPKKGGKGPGAQHQGHYKGELGGLARLEAVTWGMKLRLHDPTSVKMFATHDGHAKKPEVEAAVSVRWGWDFSSFNPPPTKTKKGLKENRQTSEDLADAAAVAQLVWTEIKLRRGEVALPDLGHPKEIQVFQRCTKQFPISLLGREWITGLSEE